MSSLSCQLPSGQKIGIAEEIADRLVCGVLVIDPVQVGQSPAVWEATSEVGQVMRDEFSGWLPSEIPGLKEARTLYKSFGMDPSRHRPSSEALMRRVLKGQQLYRINNVVDTCNLASLKFLLPIGMYDLTLIQGDITLRTGREGEEYPGIRKGPVHLAGRLGLFDDVGPFGSPTSDSARTCTSDSTNQILAVIMATAAYDRGQMADQVAIFSELFKQYCGGVTVGQDVLGGLS